MDNRKLIELALSLENDKRASKLASKGTEKTNRLIRNIRNKRFDKRDWERLDRMRSQSKPKTITKSTGVSIEDLIREAEELDAKGKLSESDLNRIQEIRNEVSSRLLGDNVSIDDIIEESVNSLKKPTRSKKAPDYRGVLPKHLQKMNPASIIQQAEDQKFNRKMRDGQSLAREAARDDYNRLPSETRWDPLAQEETDLLAKYAKEDSLQRGRDKLRTQRDVINNYGDIAYKEGYNDPESRRILFDAMDEIGTDYEDALKMIKGDISGLTGNPRFANDPMIREAFENYLYDKGFPIDKIDELNKVTGGSVVSREALTEREKMLRLLEEIEAQTGIDKMFSTKLRDGASAVGGVIDETPVELTGMSQMGRRQMNDDLKNRLVAYRTRKGATTGVDIDDVLLNPYLSTKDLSGSKRVQKYLREEEARLNAKYNPDPKTILKKKRDQERVSPEDERYVATRETDIDDDFIQAALELDINPREIDSKYKAANTLHTKAKEAYETGDFPKGDFLENKAREMIDEAAALDEQVTEQMGKKRSDYEYLFDEPTRIDEVNREYFDPKEKTGGTMSTDEEIRKRRRELYDAYQNTPQEKRVPIYSNGKWYETKAKEALRKMYLETKRK